MYNSRSRESCIVFHPPLSHIRFWQFPAPIRHLVRRAPYRVMHRMLSGFDYRTGILASQPFFSRLPGHEYINLSKYPESYNPPIRVVIWNRIEGRITIFGAVRDEKEEPWRLPVYEFAITIRISIPVHISSKLPIFRMP